MMSSELEKAKKGKLLPSTLSNATSATGSEPIIFASYFSPLVMVITIFFALPAT